MLGRLLSILGLSIAAAGVILLIAGVSQAGEKPMSYKEWKSQKIHTCGDHLKSLKVKFAKASKDSESAKDIDQEMTQENWRLEVAKELTIKDYMILYVAPQLTPENASQRLKEIAAMLSKEEIAQVLETYVQLLSPTQAANRQMRIQALMNER